LCSLDLSFFFFTILHAKIFWFWAPKFSYSQHTNFITSLLNYLLTPWSRVLLEKLTVNFAASQEIPRIYETRKFVTVPTRARHLFKKFYGCVILPLETLPPEIRMVE
jgi:hypothetical protein